MSDRSSDHDPEAGSTETAVEQLRALRSEFAAAGVDATQADPAAASDGPAADVPPMGPQAADPVDLAAALRIVEALLFAAPHPLDEARLVENLPPGVDVGLVLEELQATYAGRGIALRKVAGKWSFRTADDLSHLMEKHAVEERRLSRAALETLSIIAYHQPVTRAEIEAIRGVATSKGTLDVLLESHWVRPRGRRRAPGKPITYGTTDAFLEHFGLDTVKDLPGLAELRAAGLLDDNLPPDFRVPAPNDVAALMPDELPLDDAEDAEVEQGELELDADPDDPDAGGPETGAHDDDPATAETGARTDGSDDNGPA